MKLNSKEKNVHVSSKKLQENVATVCIVWGCILISQKFVCHKRKEEQCGVVV